MCIAQKVVQKIRKSTLSEVMYLKEIKNSRKKKGITQEQLAKLTGLSRNTIINFENDKRNPRVKDLRKIANALSVPIEQLISDSELEQA